MFRCVMAAIDLAHPESWPALTVAAEIARRDGADLHVATVVPDFGMTIVAGFFPKDFEAQARAHAREALDRLLADQLPDTPDAFRLVGYGEPVEEILRLAGIAKADLVVMASHRPRAARSLLIGSCADKLVHEAPMSVLVLREP